MRVELIEALKQTDGPAIRAVFEAENGTIFVVKLFDPTQMDPWTVKTVPSNQFYTSLKSYWSTKEPVDKESVRVKATDALAAFSKAVGARIIAAQPTDPSMESILDTLGVQMGSGEAAGTVITKMVAMLDDLGDAYVVRGPEE